MLMTPGDIVRMLNEMGRMRVQTTSPSLGAASVRIQGMRGGYTRVLSDGLPLSGEVGGSGCCKFRRWTSGKCVLNPRTTIEDLHALLEAARIAASGS